MEDLLARIEAAEKRIAALEQKAKERVEDAVEVIKADLRRRGVYGAKFFTTPSNYYDWTLDERAAFLGGDVSQLCKSIIFENVACDHNNCDDPTNSRFYCVIVQYVGKSFFHLFLAACDYSYRMSLSQRKSTQQC